MGTTIAAALMSILLVGSLAAQSSAARLFERLQGLVGRWETKYPDGHPVVVSYELVSAGKAVLERVIDGEHGESGMVSIFHLDGDRIGVSHFCSAGNRPRFRSDPVRGDTVRFRLIPESIAGPQEGHIHEFEFRFSDRDHLETEWAWFDGGKADHALVRKQRRLETAR